MATQLHRNSAPSIYHNVVIKCIDNLAFRNRWSRQDAELDDYINATQIVLANLIAHLVKNGLMNNDQFQRILEIDENKPDFELIDGSGE